jgi:hypothetical protein
MEGGEEGLPYPFACSPVSLAAAPSAAGGRRAPTVAKREGGGHELGEREERAERGGGLWREGDRSQGRERERKKRAEEAGLGERWRKR